MARNKKELEKQKNSTLAIDVETSLRLDVFTRKHQITKKDFIKQALDYFERTNIDPASDVVDITEIDKIKNILLNMSQDIRDTKSLQADAALKLTAMGQNLSSVSNMQESTVKLLENKTGSNKRHWWQKK
jgi:hypothetical protein